MDNLTSPEQLQLFFKANDKIKFCVKVFYVLQFVEKYPDFKNVCGASWCSDGKHFISNSELLGKTLSIKPNTVNTNFRSHYFKMIPFKAVNLSSEFPNLPDLKNWKKRINQQFNFSDKSIVEEINLIPCQSLANLKSQRENLFNQTYSAALNAPFKLSFQPVPNSNEIINYQNETAITQPIPNCNTTNIPITMQLPPETQQLLCNDQEILFNTTFLLNKVKNNRNKINFITQYATQEWLKIVGNSPRSNPNLILNAILENYTNAPGVSQLRTNILYLLLFQTESTQQEEEGITFDQFLNFYLRYGPISKSASYINDLTQYNDNPSDFMAPCPSQSSQANSQKSPFFISHFYPWFQPTFNASVSNKILGTKPVSTWLLRPSATPGKFTVHYRSGERSGDVSATYIEFSPLCDEPFSVLIEGIGTVAAASWGQILFEVMKLDPANAVRMEQSQQQSSNQSQQAGWNEAIMEQASPFFFTPSQIDLQLSSSQRFF